MRKNLGEPRKRWKQGTKQKPSTFASFKWWSTGLFVLLFVWWSHSLWQRPMPPGTEVDQIPEETQDSLPVATPIAEISAKEKAAPTATPTSERNLSEWIRREAQEYEKLTDRPEVILARLRATAAALTSSEREQLALKIVSPFGESSISSAERNVALHLLKLDVPRSLPQLESIALAPMPKDLNRRVGDHLDEKARLRQKALALRLGALEGIESAALAQSQFIENLRSVREKTTEKTISEVAQLSLREVARGRSFFNSYNTTLAGGEAR
jgi:hypothetical protein